MDWLDDRQPLPAVENTAYVVAANRARASSTTRLTPGPAAAWSSTSRARLAEASPGPGERIVVAPLDISALRTSGAAPRPPMLAHLRTEAYPSIENIYPAPLEG